jgi:uncharacterized membrane protein
MQARARYRRGQIAVILTLAIPALIGAIAFGTDIAVLYVNWTQLQKGTDTAVMAGAVYLPSDPAVAISTARSYARICGIRNDEIVATQIGPDRSTISMTVTRKVNLVTRFLGMGQGNIAANSTAIVHPAPSGDGPMVHRLSASRGSSHRMRAPCSGLREFAFAQQRPIEIN